MLVRESDLSRAGSHRRVQRRYLLMRYRPDYRMALRVLVSSAVPPVILSPQVLSPSGYYRTGAPLGSRGADAETVKHQVQGRIYFDHGLPGFGGAEARVGEIKTDDGDYALPYDAGGKAANIEVLPWMPRATRSPLRHEFQGRKARGTEPSRSGERPAAEFPRPRKRRLARRQRHRAVREG